MNRALIAACGVTVASAALAQEFELRNDRLEPGGLVAVQLGFVNDEIGGATFTVAPSNFPLRVKKVQIFWKSNFGGSTNSIQDSIVVCRGLPGALTIVFESDPVQLIDGALNQVDLTNENVIINTPGSGNTITIGLRFSDAPAGRANAASMVTDTAGCQFGKNAIFAIGGPLGSGWWDACFFGVSGNFVVRAIVEPDRCYADCDTSTGRRVLDIFDFLCFQNQYAAAAPSACNCDVSTGQSVCDIFDFLCFQNAFAAGCP